MLNNQKLIKTLSNKEVGENLRTIRERAIAKGLPLVSIDEINAEVESNRINNRHNEKVPGPLFWVAVLCVMVLLTSGVMG